VDRFIAEDSLGFTPEQLEAINAPDRRVIVRAGAGAGKTRVLTHRVVRRVLEEGIDPGHVLVATFTRKAAGELRTRLHAAGVEDVRAGTFHRAALELVRDTRAERDLAPPVLAPDRHRLFVAVVDELDLHLPAPAVARLEAELSWAKARRLDGSTYAAGARTARRRTPTNADQMSTIIETYDRLCRRRGVLDFDGLLEEATTLLEHDTGVRDSFRWRTRHLFVDELQDMNPAQFDLLCAMAGDDPDLFGVGDANQSIYGWNGADPHLLDVIATKWTPTRTLSLPRNHRSTEAIVRAATAALGRGPLDLLAATDGGSIPRIAAYPDDDAEAKGVASWCREMHGPSRWWRQTAILARTNAALDLFAAACTAVGVPTYKLGAEGSPASDLDAEIPRRWDTPEAPDAVVLSTIHRAKGLEWDHVALTGLAEGRLPLGGASSSDQLDEERRLLYVGMTRPESELLCTWSRDEGVATRSRFLEPVAAELEAMATERRPLEGTERSRRIAELRAVLPPRPER
jgi:DNA helicase II / ATP-dependent DNA helicase PcrA